MKRLPLRYAIVLPLFAMLFVLGACGEDSDSPTNPPPAETGGMAITVTGMPDGVPAAIEVTGPNSFQRTVTESTTLTGLATGNYLLTASSQLSGDVEYSPTQATSNIVIGVGAPRPVTVSFTSAVVRGSLHVNISGLPQGTPGLLTVIGPDSYQKNVTLTETIESLVPGTYTVSASMVAVSQTNYVPFPEQETVDVVAGNEAASNFAYGEQTNSSLDLFIAGYQLTQATQREDGGVPMIRDREALLRVFGQANEINLAQTDIRAEVFINGLLEHTEMISRAENSAPRSVDYGDLSNSWNWTIPASLVQPNMSLRLEIDPTNLVAEQLENNNRYPLSGDPTDVNVSSVGPLELTLVPMVNGTTGDVNSNNADDYADVAERMFPFPSVDVQVHAPFTPGVSGPLVWNDSNGVWIETLEALLALRNITDQSDRYYYGVVSTSYNAGVAGLGYIPNSRSDGYNAAIGWDKNNSRSGVMTHELGHNLGRAHSPCGGAAGPDPLYPYSGALIGQWGYDQGSDQLMNPNTHTDIMGYCDPQWISDYTFEKILTFMGGNPPARALPSMPCVMVWGRVVDGEIFLRPSFLLEATPRMPSERGDLSVEAHDADGGLVFRFSFDPVPVADHPGGDRSTFAWMVPVSLDQAERMAQIELRGQGRRVQHESARAMAKQASTRVAHRLIDLGGNRRMLEWDAAAHPMVLVRDPRTREIIAFARNGRTEFPTSARELELLFSDGVQSLRMNARVD